MLIPNMDHITAEEDKFTADLTRKALIKKVLTKQSVEINLMDVLIENFRKSEENIE